MRTLLQIGGYELEFDRDATAACYAHLPAPGPEACDCADCRNWIAARDHVLPTGLRDLLLQFGIPIKGEIEVWEAPSESQPHFYGGWYFVVGRILSGELKHRFNVDAFQLSFTTGRSFSVPAFEGHEVCELHFQTEIGEYLSESERDRAPRPKST